MEFRHPLVEVCEHVREQSRHSRVAVVFDLDSTLFGVSPRTQHILRQLAREPDFVAQFADVAKILSAIEVLPTDYSVKQVLARTSITPSEELAQSVRKYWRKHFFSSHHLDKDILYPSANEYVTHLHALGAEILYLTGRNEGSMREGTIRSLYGYGFPLYNDSHLMMKPSDQQTDEHFKVTKMKELVHRFDHIWFFENEPVIIHDIRQATPTVHIVFVNSSHSGKAPPPQDLRTILPDFTFGIPKK